MRDWLTETFHGVTEKGWGVLRPLLKVLPNSGGFAGDNLITFGKTLGFLDDQKFMSAFQAANPDAQEESQIWRSHVLCWAARRALGVPGDFVEAACYKGFTARVLCNALDFAGTGRDYWLYDLFDPPAGYSHLLEDHGGGLHERVVQRFADIPRAHVVKGSIPESFARGEPARVAFLHVDMNAPEPEIATLDRFYPRMPSGAIIVLDDFGWAYYREQRIHTEKWCRARGLDVLELPTGQGLIIKP